MPPAALTPATRQRPWYAAGIPPVLAHKWRVPSLLALLLFSLWFPWQIMATLHLGAYLGPGLGDALSYQYLQALWGQADAAAPYAGMALRLGFVLLGVWIAGITFFSAIHYEKSVGEAFPWGKFWQLLLLNAVLAMSLALCTALVAALLWAAGVDFAQAYAFVERGAVSLNDWVYTHIPTVVHLPRVLAFLLIYTLSGPAAVLGEQARNGFQLALEDLGGTLGGNGTVGNLVVASGGTVAPGNSIGTLTVSGNYSQTGGVYQVEVNSAGQNDKIVATGTATCQKASSGPARKVAAASSGRSPISSNAPTSGCTTKGSEYSSDPSSSPQ